MPTFYWLPSAATSDLLLYRAPHHYLFSSSLSRDCLRSAAHRLYNSAATDSDHYDWRVNFELRSYYNSFAAMSNLPNLRNIAVSGCSNKIDMIDL
jgi:hypothetical protein